MTTIELSHEHDAATEIRVGALADRLFQAGAAAIDLFTVYLGLRLDLYRTLAAHGGLTPPELADATQIAPRYAREWLEQQTVAGIVACDDRTALADARRYRLFPGHDTVLLDADHPAYLAPLALALAGVAGVLPQLLAAYRSGNGVPYAAYGADFRDGQAGFNRPGFTNLLAESWLAVAFPDLHAHLSAGERIRIADIACGAGWSTIALARAYPHAHIDGFDLDDASIADARRNATAAGVGERVTFEVRDAARLPAGSYDLVCVFEALHDMSDPIGVLRSLAGLRSGDGHILLMDEKVADSFAESAGPIEAFLYGASVLHCLPVGMSEQPSAATGAILRTEIVARYAAEAGFDRVDVLPIEHDLFRFYSLS